MCVGGLNPIPADRPANHHALGVDVHALAVVQSSLKKTPSTDNLLASHPWAQEMPALAPTQSHYEKVWLRQSHSDMTFDLAATLLGEMSKKPKFLCKFNPKWKDKFNNEVKEAPGNIYVFCCMICDKVLSCEHMGEADISRHIKSLLYQKNREAKKPQRL